MLKYFNVLYIGIRKKHAIPEGKRILYLVEKFDKQNQIVDLQKCDIQEKFTAGSTKGGQKANKSHSIVFLRHVPTGKTAKGNESRLLPDNYKVAMAKLRMAVDIHIKGDESAFLIYQKKQEELAKTEAERKKELHIKRLEKEQKLKEILAEEDLLKY